MESIDVAKKLIDEYNVIIPTIVLEELDNLKDNKSDTRSQKARHAIKLINSEYDNVSFDIIERDGKPDNQIVQSAIDNHAILATNDICVKVKGLNSGLDVKTFIGNTQEYKGYTVLEIDTTNPEDNELMARIYGNEDGNILNLYINEYLIIRDTSNEELDEKVGEFKPKTIDILKWNGSIYTRLVYPPKKVIKPLNDLQACALDLLFNKDIPIKIIAGLHGSGKTYLATTMGVHFVEEKGDYSKLILVRNTDTQDKDGAIGFLPGSLEDKTSLFFQTITQYLPMGEYQARRMESEGKLEYHIPYYMRGLSLSGFMIFDEAQQSTLSDIKKIGTRLEDGCICLTGDWKQASGRHLRDNGMTQLIEQTKEEPLVGVIVLDLDVRSDASLVFANLEE